MSYRVQAWSRDKWSLKQIRLETTLSFMKLVEDKVRTEHPVR
jgi:hypothetical protein